MADSLWVGGALYDAEDVAKLLDELCAARLAVQTIRVEVAEGIAKAIEAHNATLMPGDDVFQDEGKAYLETAAAIARGYTHTGQGAGDG